MYTIAQIFPYQNIVSLLFLTMLLAMFLAMFLAMLLAMFLAVSFVSNEKERRARMHECGQKNVPSKDRGCLLGGPFVRLQKKVPIGKKRHEM